MNNKIAEAAESIRNAKHLVAFTGAGISVESGIPPFRGETGLWSKYDPKVLDLTYFYDNPKAAWTVIRELFYDFFGSAKPNPAHQALALLEKNGHLKSIITQNIDNLHQEAGSQIVYEYHGTSQYLIDTKTNKKYTIDQVNMDQLPVVSPDTGNLLKPDFIFFGEGIPQDAYSHSVRAAQMADLFLVIGTTGEIMPASLIPMDAKKQGAKIIEINIETSNYTHSITDIFIQEKASVAMSEIIKYLNL